MNVLLIDEENCGLAFAMRIRDYDHEVYHWMPPLKDGTRNPIGKGLVHRVDKWEPHLKWADLIVLTGNSMYRDDIGPLFEKGYPIVGACDKGAELETNREKGQQILERYGIEVPSYQAFKNFDDAIAHVKKTKLPYAVKPWGGTADKALTFVADSWEDLVFKLERWKQEGKLKGSFMLQELVEGVEMGTAGWFGPGGWCIWLEESWEFKKFMDGDVGCNTGEQGTVQRFTKKSKLFDEALKPITEYLDEIEYVGNVSVNCIIDKKGQPWPLEFTCRLGWPEFNLQLALTLDDPVEWLLDLQAGSDTMEVSGDVAVGVVLTHGDYPHGRQTLEQVSDYPIRGITNSNVDHLYFQQVKEQDGPVTAGDYVMVVVGTGGTVGGAYKATYKVVEEISWPNSHMYRTDIGKKLRKELPLLQAHGFATGLEY